MNLGSLMGILPASLIVLSHNQPVIILFSGTILNFFADFIDCK